MNDMVINNLNANQLTVEQKQQLATLLNINIDNICTINTSEVNNLIMKDNSSIAIDPFSREEFDISLLSDTELKIAKKTGLSPKSFALVQEAEAIKQAAHKFKATRNRAPISAGARARNVINAYKNQMNAAFMKKLLNQDFCRDNFSLYYPLFISVSSNADAITKKDKRYVKGHPRYSPTEYRFDNITDTIFFMTNNIFAHNANKLEQYFNTHFAK